MWVWGEFDLPNVEGRHQDGWSHRRTVRSQIGKLYRGCVLHMASGVFCFSTILVLETLGHTKSVHGMSCGYAGMMATTAFFFG